MFYQTFKDSGLLLGLLANKYNIIATITQNEEIIPVFIEVNNRQNVVIHAAGKIYASMQLLIDMKDNIANLQQIIDSFDLKYFANTKIGKLNTDDKSKFIEIGKRQYNLDPEIWNLIAENFTELDYYRRIISAQTLMFDLNDTH